jgi:hypothetical protein
MIVEERIYTLKIAGAAEWFKAYEAEGMKIQLGHLGHMVGYYTTDIGMLNQVVHLWAYSDLKDRQDRRAQLAADKSWQAYLAKILPLIQTMESKILVPTPFSPKP